MSYGARFWDPGGALTFDTTAEHTLFFVDERFIAGSTVGSGISFSYPAFAGKKVAAFMQCPYGTGDVDGWLIQSCRVSYPGGIPTVSVFFDNPGATNVDGTAYNAADGYLIVMWTGATQ